MNKTIVFIALIIVLGGLIALGPLFVFRICNAAEMSEEDIEISCCGPIGYPRCQWTAQAEIGIGMLVAALGLCMLVFSDIGTRLGLSVGVCAAGLIALLVPYALIRGCASEDMRCHLVAFPALAVESLVLMACSALLTLSLKKQKDAA